MTWLNNSFWLSNNTWLNNSTSGENFPMANILPTDLIPNYSLLAATDPAPSQGIFIPLASLPSLTAIEANATTGDGREVVRSLIKTIQTTYTSIPTANRPAEMTAIRNADSVQGNDTYRQSWTFTFDVVADPNAVTMSPEA